MSISVDTEGTVKYISGVGGARMPVWFHVDLRIRMCGEEYMARFVVVRNMAEDASLGNDTMGRMKLILDQGNHRVVGRRTKEVAQFVPYMAELQVQVGAW